MKNIIYIIYIKIIYISYHIYNVYILKRNRKKVLYVSGHTKIQFQMYKTRIHLRTYGIPERRRGTEGYEFPV